MNEFKINCPNCHVTIRVPFVRELKVQAIKDADMLEVTARDKLLALELWLNSTSIFGLLKWWIKRR